MQEFLFPIDKVSSDISNVTDSSSDTKIITSWEAMSPYVMAEHIAEISLEQNNPTLAQRRGTTVTIDTSNEYMRSNANIPDPPLGIRNLATKSDTSSKFLFDVDLEDDQYIEAPRRSKRLHSSIDSNEENDDVDMMPLDPSFLIVHNPNEMTARLAVTEISSLARQIESSKSFGACYSSYKRFRNFLLEKSTKISESRKPDDDKKVLFNKLYSESVMHMKALVRMTELHSTDDDKLITLPQRKEINDEDKYVSTNVSSNPNPHMVAREFDKKFFTHYMNNWLKNNWTNPYPDDKGLSEMATENGTTETIISNWLINARTRKWRPSIVKAFELGRPADMLMEDSIRIFDGENAE